MQAGVGNNAVQRWWGIKEARSVMEKQAVRITIEGRPKCRTAPSAGHACSLPCESGEEVPACHECARAVMLTEKFVGRQREGGSGHVVL